MKNTDKQTDKWITDNGLDTKTFNATDIEILQARKIAHRLLKEHAKLLGQNEAAALNNFIRAVASSKNLGKVTLGQCYKVMNIGTAVNRKLFKAHRKIKG